MDIQVGQHWRTRGGHPCEVVRKLNTGLLRYDAHWKRIGTVVMWRCRANSGEFWVDDRGFYCPSDGEHPLDLIARVARTVA